MINQGLQSLTDESVDDVARPLSLIHTQSFTVVLLATSQLYNVPTCRTRGYARTGGVTVGPESH